MSDPTLTATTIVDLFAEHLVFEPDGAARRDQRRMFTEESGWRLGMFHADTDDEVHADHWERHPNCEEAVSCVRGGIRVVLRAERQNGTDDVVALPAGRGTIVPRGRWHRIELDEPSDLLVVTVRSGSQLEPVGP
jgi:mannose-6-phosphate isomerase-like protein (cupin superfamily)